MGFKIIDAQAQNTSLNARLKKGLRSRPSTSAGPLITSPKYRPKTRVQFTPLKGWQPKESILGENTQSSPIGKVRYFPIIAHQLSLINRFTIKKENILPSGRNIVSSSNKETYYSVSSSNKETYYSVSLSNYKTYYSVSSSN